MNSLRNASAEKLALLGRVILRPGIWDAQAEAWAKLIPHDTPIDALAHWMELIQKGEAEMFDAVSRPLNAKNGGALRVGFLVLTVCHDFPTPELIILGAFCSDFKSDLTSAALPQIMAMARQRGCATVRFHTMRPGLIKKAMQDGFTVSEVILRKDVSHGH